MSLSDLTIGQLEEEIDRLSDDIERKQDRGQTVMPEEHTRLRGLQTLLEAKRHASDANS